MVFTAPAKVNLYLKVLSRRNDGYHNIETIFEKISLSDEVKIERTKNNTEIASDNSSIPVGPDSLMGRAVRLFNERSENKYHFKIYLKKNIPIGAGLGGGSSDAAAVLGGINEITGSKLEKNTLISIAGDLGADVPFFLSGTSFAYGTERGDKIREVHTSLKMWHVLVNPPFEVLTKGVYKKLPPFGLTKNIALDRILSAFLKNKEIKNLAKNLHNDLQPIVLQEFDVLKRVFRELKNAGAEGVLLSGSGPTVFGIFEEKEAVGAARKMQEIFPEKENWRVYLASTYQVGADPCVRP